MYTYTHIYIYVYTYTPGTGWSTYLPPHSPLDVLDYTRRRIRCVYGYIYVCVCIYICVYIYMCIYICML